MSKSLSSISGESPFDQIKHVTAKGGEYWRARELFKALEYADWDNFENVIKKAQAACLGVGEGVDDHFRETTEMVGLGSGAKRPVRDLFLTRHGCYLIAMNGESKKKVIAEAQTYFARQTRKQEIQDSMTEDQRRLHVRARVRNSNTELMKTAHISGVENFPRFQNAGYQGLYDGWGVRELKRNKGIPDGQDFLDCIGREELAANEFRITQTEKRLKEEQIRSENEATEVHRNVGIKVRKAIADIGGTMPEKLPAEENIAKLLKTPENKAFAQSLKEKPPSPETLVRPTLTLPIAEAKWKPDTRVVVVGVANGTLTQDGTGFQNFENLEAARELFPDLDTHKDTSRFTRAIGNPDRDAMRFETWAAYAHYDK